MIDADVGGGNSVRYDFMVATALAMDAEDSAGKIAQWRQLADLLVQARGALSNDLRDVIVSRITVLRSQVPAAQRRLAATQLAGRVADVDGIDIFGTDEPAVAAPILSTAVLSAEAWIALLPRLPAASRLLVRNRRDLPAAVTVALGSYGHSDFGLPDGAAANMANNRETQIRDLVARIDAFRRSHAEPHRNADAERPVETFVFETDVRGVIDWVADAPREALMGTAISDPAEAGGFGVDGQVAGAFRRRAPFRNGRLSVAGSGPASGLWLLSASPVFNPRDGRFAGYNGFARRPRADEVAEPAACFSGTALPVDSLRQLIHELRTPLNAILGFADMIDQQLLGPAALPYRSRAEDIAADGRRMLELVEDLDSAARTQSSADDVVMIESRQILEDVVRRLEPASSASGAKLHLLPGARVEVARIGSGMLQRMMSRLIGAALGLARRGEAIDVELTVIANIPTLIVARPLSLTGVEDVRLLDPSFEPESQLPDVSLLGLGFTLRLIENLARSAGGRFAIRDDSFVLTLVGPHARDSLPVGASGE